MKKNFLLTILALGFLCTACNKDGNDTSSLECQDVNYSSAFSIEANNKYCFPDEVSLTILDIKNEFCPCFANCIWEGEMVIDMQWILASGETTIFSFHQAATINDSLPSSIMVTTDVENIVFENDCTSGDPSPAITSTIITVTN